MIEQSSSQSLMRFWHPVIPVRKLQQTPLSVSIAGLELIVYRTNNGVNAIHRYCPHRGMDLVGGVVVDDGIICPFHGWKQKENGESVDSDGTLITCEQQKYQAVQSHGYIWVRLHSDDNVVPMMESEGLPPVILSEYTAKASFNAVVDIFNEAEHTADTHIFLGYDKQRKEELEIETLVNEDTVKIINRGPQKKIPFPVSILMPFRNGDYFHDIFTTKFAPVKTRYDHVWKSPDGKKTRDFRLVQYMYFVPISAHETRIVLFGYMGSSLLKVPLLSWFVKRFMRFFSWIEMRQDMKILQNVKDQSESVLNRYDEPLKPIREKISLIYYQEET
jgi:phenylpropionate dioxygenase-like ring-hydroxylating dioxygenase large terminal subunit